MQTVIIAILVFGLLIFVHEFGHFIVAKLVGIRVEEFSIGMGPKAFSTQKGDTLYSIRFLPIGGYVKMTGEAVLEEENDLDQADPKRFNNKSVGQRASVILAGPLMNFILAIVLFALIFSFVGIPHRTTEISDVVPNSPAAEAGLRPGDQIVQIEGQEVKDWGEMVKIIQTQPGKELSFIVKRNGKNFTIQITPQKDPETQVGLIGIIQSDVQFQKVNPLKALGLGVQRTIEILVLTVTALAQMLAGKVGAEGVAGPVGIIQMIGETAQVGLIYLINFTALISINLGLLNLLPIPALDGSKLIFIGIEALRGRPIDARKENFVHLIGFALLMLLMLFVTYRDIVRFFS